MTAQQIEELAQALTEAATALIRHRERNPAPDDGETSSFNEALDKWTAKIDAINGRAPPIESDDPVRDDLERKIEAIGAQAHAIGGNPAMVDVHDRACRIMEREGEDRDADFGSGIIGNRWHGIGDWAT